MATVLGAGELLPELQQRLNSELRPGERVVWSTQPRKSSAVVPTFFLVPFGLIFAGMPLFFFVIPAFSGSGFGHPPVGFGFFGLIFVFVGLAMVTSPIWALRSAGGTIYAVTDQRALVIRPRTFGGVHVESFLPERLTGMTRSEKADGSGHLIFEQFTERAGSGSRTVRRGFIGIDRVRDVENLILSTLVTNRNK